VDGVLSTKNDRFQFEGSENSSSRLLVTVFIKAMILMNFELVKVRINATRLNSAINLDSFHVAL